MGTFTDNAKIKQNRLTAGDILRSIRETRNIPIKVVAETIGVSALAIQKIERNTSSGSFNTLNKLCNFYEISMEDLAFWTTEESNTDIAKAKDLLYKMLINAVYKRAEKNLSGEHDNTDQIGGTELSMRVDDSVN